MWRGFAAMALVASALALPMSVSMAVAGGGPHTYAGSISGTGCGWQLVVDASAESVDLTLTDQADCASAHLSAEVTGTFDGSSTRAPGTGGPTEPGTAVTLVTLEAISARVLGQQISDLTNDNLDITFDLGVSLQQAAQGAATAQQAVQGAAQTLAGDVEPYLAGLLVNQLTGAHTGLDFNKPLEALTNAQEAFCAAFAGGGTPIKGPPQATYANCDPPMCPAASGGNPPNACTSVNSDTDTLGGGEGSSQDQLCPATQPNPDYLFVCVPTFVVGSYDAGQQSVVLLPGGALVANPVGGSLNDLTAGPTLSSSTAIVSLGGLIMGGSLTLKAPQVLMAAGAAQMLGHLTVDGSKSVSIGDVELGDLAGLIPDLSSISSALQTWTGLANTAGINDKAFTSLVFSPSLDLPMNVSGAAVSVTSPDFTLGASSEIDTQGRGGTTGVNLKQAFSQGSGGWFGASHGGYGGIFGTLGNTWYLWHTMSTRTPTYDNPFDPTQPGTGIPSLPGGGVVRIDAHTGSAQINGTIDVDGFWEPKDPSYVYQCSSGGSACPFGAGGSVFITAKTLSGGGTVSAQGASVCGFEACVGQLYDGAGGGGRIAVLYGREAGWAGSLEAYGGWYRWLHGGLGLTYPDGTGGAGTVFTRQVVFDRSGGVSKGMGTFPAGTLTVDGGQTRGWYPPPEYYPPPDATPVLPSWGSPQRQLVVTGNALVWATKLHFGEIDVLSRSTVITPPGVMKLNVTTPLLKVDASSEVTVNSRGYNSSSRADKAATAPGRKPSGLEAGGSHGGKGGNNDSGNNNSNFSGATYDSVEVPHLPGASGGVSGNGGPYDGNPGGGVLDLNVGSLQLAGTISANGEDAAGPTAVEQAFYSNEGGGGGAGGSILAHVARLSGSGAVSANGGLACLTGGQPLQPKFDSPGACGAPQGGPGGGGGGRVAVYVGAECNWSGDMTAVGGVDQTSVAVHDDKTAMGQAGTVYLAKGDGTC